MKTTPQDLRPRLIPMLLIENRRLIKTTKFNNPKYLGDPLNALRIYNEQCADEIIIIDKSISTAPDLALLDRMVSEAFMPISYVGNINSISDFKDVFNLGIEKVGSGSLLFKDIDLINQACAIWGSSSIFIMLNISKEFKDYYCRTSSVSGSRLMELEHALKLIKQSKAGEVIVQNINLEGTMKGLEDTPIKILKDYLNIPIISSGGASSIQNCLNQISSLGISGVSAGSIFSFYGSRKAVLINYEYK